MSQNEDEIDTGRYSPRKKARVSERILDSDAN